MYFSNDSSVIPIEEEVINVRRTSGLVPVVELIRSRVLKTDCFTNLVVDFENKKIGIETVKNINQKVSELKNSEIWNVIIIVTKKENTRVTI